MEVALASGVFRNRQGVQGFMFCMSAFLRGERLAATSVCPCLIQMGRTSTANSAKFFKKYCTRSSENAHAIGYTIGSRRVQSLSASLPHEKWFAQAM